MNLLPPTERREPGAMPPLTLTELSAMDVIEGRSAENGAWVAPDPTFAGVMRETCPACGVHLQLVLRQQAVKQAHLFCPDCTRCFDARYPDGSTALGWN